jgi:uncharacterized protein
MALQAPSPEARVAITGASSGIGAEIARALAQRGYPLLLIARRRDRLEELAAAVPVDAQVHVADLQDGEARKALHEPLKACAGLVNNAGYGSHGPVIEQDLEWETGMVELNVKALLELTLAVLPAYVERGHGAVMNVASLAANQPLPTMATYAATKAFVHNFSEAVHEELAGTGVSVTSLCPGPVPTEFGKVAGAAAFDEDRGLPKPISMDAPSVAEAGVRGMVKGARTVVPGLTWKAASLTGRVMPRTALLPAFKRVVSRV